MGVGNTVTAWCRGCGFDQAAQIGACTSCGADLAITEPDPSPIGLVFEVRGKLGVGKKLAICLGSDGDTLLLHLSAKDKEPARLPVATAPTEVVPAHLGQSSRLLYAAQLPEGKQSWDIETLRHRSAELCADVRILRRLVDDALAQGWQHIIEWAPLSPTEKAWRRAHHAAATGDLAGLREALGQLPDQGYAARVSLLAPHLGAIRHDARTWHPVVDRMARAGLPGAAAMSAAGVGRWHEALGSAASLLPTPRAAVWAALAGELQAGTSMSQPPFHDAPAWTAASIVADPARGPVDGALDHLTGLEAALWDDLIDEGRISASAPLLSAPDGLRTYLLARLDPARLSDAEARAVGHTGELARRLFLSRDRATLSGLGPTPRVQHYQALLDVIDSGRADPDRLAPETVRLLELPTTVLGQLKDGAVRSLPHEIIGDPSLWTIFADLAVNGTLLPDAQLAADHPLNVWIGLNRLLGLLWEGKYDEAIDHGHLLLPQLKRVEQQEDEALNLIAFALDQRGRVDEALSMLENALQGSYTENLLVNVSIVAARARPEVGVRHLARLVEEAPTAELQRAGLDKAISVWQGTDLDFPQVLVPALRTVLGTAQPIDEYLRLGIVGVNVAPQVIQALPNPGGELDGPFRLLQVRARWKVEKDFYIDKLADAYIDIYRSVGRVDWFMDDWKSWVDTIQETIFVDFGEGLGSAQFVDQVLVNAPELFADEELFILAPQAGTHLNVNASKESSWLNDRAMAKFFFDPIERFQQTRGNFNDGFAEHLATNFTLCLGNVAIHMLGAGRDVVAGEYNPLVERLRWDSQNQYAIVSQMGRVLDDAERGVLTMLDRIVETMRRLGSDEKRELTRTVANDVAEWHDEIIRLRRNL